MFTGSFFQMSLIRNSAFLILEVINLETQLSLANGKRLKVYPEINKLKGIEDWDSLELKNFTISGILFPHNIVLLLAVSICQVWLPEKPKQKMFHIHELLPNHWTEKNPVPLYAYS